jgi:DNA-binding NarL/FixJ family response regulator
VRAVAEGDIDVCLMDLTFPGASGFDAIRAITASSPTTHVVVLSGSSTSEERALDAGATAFVVKDDDLERVIGVVEHVHRHGVAPASPRGSSDPVTAGDGSRTHLTAREQEVLERLVRGERTQAIAAGMGISYATARTHVQNVLHKLGVHSRLEAVAFALNHALVSVDRHAG